MPKSIPVIFKRTLLATAILSLSACSSMPPVSDITLGSVGAGIAKAGRATADVTRKTWNTTTYYLGFTDTLDGKEAPPSDDQLLLAEEDLNQIRPRAARDLPEIEGSNSNRPVLVQQATATATGEAPELPEIITSSSGDLLAVAGADLTHEVAESETLWDIAKKTTGDANNWHVLADVNELGQSATVFPGQTLTIPADLVKPGYGMSAAELDALRTADATDGALRLDNSAQALDDAPQQIDTAVVADNTRLAIPSADTSTELQIDKDIALARMSQNAKSFEIGEGETLWEFSKRTTGNATNWQAIATHNNFSEKQAVTVRPGQTIFVPQELVRERQQAASTIAPKAPAESTVASLSISDPIKPAAATPAAVQNTTAAVTTAAEQGTVVTIASSEMTAAELQLQQRQQLQQRVQQRLKLQQQAQQETQLNQTDTTSEPVKMVSSASMADETQGIKIVEATYKTNDTLDPITAQAEPVQIVENANIPELVMVSGTYYPKAVYNYADFSSSLLMRVSPGTKLQVSRAMGTWFEVKTDKGLGYVHQRDIK